MPKENEDIDVGGGLVTVNPKKVDDQVNLVQEEVPQSEIVEQATRAIRVSKLDDVATEIRNMAGNAYDDVKAYLDTLKKDGVIVAYRPVPIGATTTLELNPGRVTVVVDANGMIIDAEMS
jgi:hypothetical protein